MAPVRRFRSLAWMNARKLPGVRCSTLKTACNSLLCLITMPGRIWVAGIDIKVRNSPKGLLPEPLLGGRPSHIPRGRVWQTLYSSLLLSILSLQEQQQLCRERQDSPSPHAGIPQMILLHLHAAIAMTLPRVPAPMREPLAAQQLQAPGAGTCPDCNLPFFSSADPCLASGTVMASFG